jgi:chromosomal replication initiator protein
MVATHFGVPVEEMKSPSRKRDYTRPRQVAMFFAREIGHKSYPNIGHMFGGRDHTTVIHGVRAVEELMSKDGEFSHEVTSLLLTLGSAKDNEAGDKSHFLAFATNDAGA